MVVAVNDLKRSLKRWPNIYRAHLNLAIFRRCIQYRLQADDDCRLRDHWDFSTPVEQARHSEALSAATSITGPSLGDVLEVGCHEGRFTAHLSAHARSVTAVDVSDESCARARDRCADLSNVNIQRVNVLKESVTGQYDVIFVMGLLCYFKGTRRLKRVSDKFNHSLRAGGLLVIQEMRLIPEVEDSFWVRWLGEGAFSVLEFFHKHSPFVPVRQEIEEKYVTAVFQKPVEAKTRESWKSRVPSGLIKAYRRIRSSREISSYPWSTDERFNTVKEIAACSGSLISAQGLARIREHILRIEHDEVPGDFVECGVYRGGSALLLGDAIKTSPMKRHLWLFDSFEGLPAPTAYDGPSAPYLKSTLKSDAAEVARLLRDHGVPPDRTTITPGWFHKTLHKANIRRIALLHIDADWYSSVKQCLNDLYHLVSPGGIVVLDDYNDWPGCKIALDEFLRENNLHVRLEGGAEGPCYFRKDG